VIELLVQNTAELVTRITLIALLPFLVAFSFIVFIFYRKSRENSLRRKQLELELKALRAQINPHFIFNCLNSIHYCIQSHETEKASSYLLKFSYLTRRVLENSTKQWISLEEDLEMLRAYLDLEQLRTGNLFSYSINVDPEIDTASTAVPMLIMQPIVENAVWHGFNKQQPDAKIQIHILNSDDAVLLQIRDNGLLAPTQKGLQPGKTKSLGSSLVNEQLQAIRELEKREATFSSISLTSSDSTHIGTITEIKIPYIPIFS